MRQQLNFQRQVVTPDYGSTRNSEWAISAKSPWGFTRLGLITRHLTTYHPPRVIPLTLDTYVHVDHLYPTQPIYKVYTQRRPTAMSSPPNPFASSPSPPSSPIVAPTPPRSVLSAASGSPPPTHRASFPDPSKEPKGEKLGDRLVGPKPKSGPCCDRDREISQGEEISIVDAFKTTEGGKASYITYVIRLGVRLSLCLCSSNSSRKDY